MIPIAAPVETKVTASTAAAAVSGIVLWTLGRYVFGGTVPDVVASWIYVLVPAAVTFTAGYLAKHTPRPAPDPALAPSDVAAAWPPKTLMRPAATGSDPGAAGPPPAGSSSP
jgi:hypothetical protein